jgi:hypothetical protein
MSDVREVVLDAMRSNGLTGYESRATPVIDALIEREQGIADRLVEFATAQGLSRDRAVTAIQDAGLVLHQPSAVNDRDWAASFDAVQDSLNQIQGQLDQLRQGRR